MYLNLLIDLICMFFLRYAPCDVSSVGYVEQWCRYGCCHAGCVKDCGYLHFVCSWYVCFPWSSHDLLPKGEEDALSPTLSKPCRGRPSEWHGACVLGRPCWLRPKIYRRLWRASPARLVLSHSNQDVEHVFVHQYDRALSLIAKLL